MAADLLDPYQTTKTMTTNSLIIMTLALTTIGLVACSEAPQNNDKMENQVDNTLEDIQQEKNAIAEEMREMRNKIEMRLTKVEAQLSDPALDAETRAKFEQEKTELKQQMDRVDGNLSEVERATKETWNDVKASSAKAADETENWFQRQKELIDQKTEVDKDHDGH